MRKIWKWILGIVLVLVVIAVVGFVAHGLYMSHTARVERFENFRPPMANNFDRDDRRDPSFGYDKFHSPQGGFDRRMPMYGNRGFGGFGFMPLPFLFFGGLLRLLFPLTVLALVGYFSYKKGKKDGMAVMSAPTLEPDKVDEPADVPKQRGRKVAKEN